MFGKQLKKGLRINFPVVVLIAIPLLYSCETDKQESVIFPNVASTETPTATAIPVKPAVTIEPVPTPNLIVADDYSDGLVGIPEGKYLFVEFYEQERGWTTSESGVCTGYSLIDEPTYKFSGGSSGDIWLYPDDDVDSLLAVIGYWHTKSGAAGGGAYSILDPIYEVPFTIESSGISIRSINEKGKIILLKDGKAYWWIANKRWVWQEVTYPDPECVKVTEYTFINHGLLDKSQIDVAD